MFVQGLLRPWWAICDHAHMLGSTYYIDRGLFGYDLEISIPLKPLMITDLSKRLGGCNLKRGL